MTTQHPATSAARRPAKSARVDVRVSSEQKALLEEAAAISGRTMSEFVLSAAQSAANDILADRTGFVLPAEQWAAFSDALSRPPRQLPKLATLLAEPSVLERE